jgi:TetR/AcrR family transcriptional repressor of bet genes
MDATEAVSEGAEDAAPRLTRRQLSAAATRDRIVEATIRCMANYGPGGVTIERITIEAGVSRGLARHHFGTKRQLLLEAFQRLADEQRAAFRGEDPATEADPVAALRAAIAATFRDALAAPARAHAWFGFWQAALGDAAVRGVNERVYAEERERYIDLFEAAARQQDLDIDCREAGTALCALVDGAWNELLMDAADFGVDHALALCDHYIDMVLERGRAGRESRNAG